MKILLASSLLLLHLGIKSTNPNAKITNNNTPAIDIQTTFLVDTDFLPPEPGSSDEDGPSTCLPGVFPDEGEVGAPESTGAGGGVSGDVGAGNGTDVSLNGFPSFLHK